MKTTTLLLLLTLFLHAEQSIGMDNGEDSMIPDPPENGYSDIEADDNAKPVKSTKRSWVRPAAYIGIAIASCAVCAVGGLKLYDWYLTKKEPIKNDEEDEATQDIA